MEPIWVSIMINNTYSCIKGRGIHKALADVKRDLKDSENTTYCLKLDVKKFYPSIDHGILKKIIRKKIKDKRLLELLDEIIDSAQGVPIGNYLSQFFANLYLSYFDHWIKEVKRISYYYRYADDIVILGSSKVELHNLLREIQKYFNDKLKLKVKENWQVFEVDKRGLSFVGYVIRHTHILLRKSIKQNMCRKSAILCKYKSITKDYYKQQMSSYFGWAKYCNSNNLMKRTLVYKDLIKHLYW